MWQASPRTNIPRLAQDLAPSGTLLSGFRNNGPTYTNSGHTALTTGFYEDIENSTGSQLPSHAGIFQHFLAASGLPASSAWVIASKDKLAILGNTTQFGWSDAFRPSLWCGVGGGGPGSGYADDADTVAKFKSVLSLYQPRLVLINLKEPDASAHAGIWNDYLAGLSSSDAYAADIWNTLQTDPTYAGTTAFFVTHDHGRHLDGIGGGFVSHGDSCTGCRAVALLAMGPDFRSGVEILSGGELIDLPVTVADILGFPLSGTSGRVLDELLK